MNTDYDKLGKEKILKSLDDALKATSWITEWNTKIEVEKLLRDTRYKICNLMNYTEE